MRKHIHTINQGIATAGLAIYLLISGCTKKFDEFNTNPYGVTENDLKVDFRTVGDPFKQAQLNIYSAQPAWLTQLQQNLIGDIYSGYMMTPTPFIGNSNNTTYDLVDSWNGTPWSTAYNQVMAPMADVQQKAK
ncbi:MAG TPA: SusD/RagB family nutrient-binding outer membrane lipoprotein, partial [Flavisolibacter sp.]|nr:SusD/RagB family nutrient-binding outer membrane lipoprotein [Flavisolibacter sp.]